MKRHKALQFIYRIWKEWWKTAAIIVFVIIPLKSSIADWNWVPSGSMNPTILEGDLIYVDKLAYDLRFSLTFNRLAEWSKPQRGDIVVCFSPEDRTRLVKRVIGLPGDTIESRSDVIFINGRPLSYTPNDVRCGYGYSLVAGDAQLRACYGAAGRILCDGRQPGQQQGFAIFRFYGRKGNNWKSKGSDCFI